MTAAPDRLERAGPLGTAIGIVRIVHAFPAGLDGLVTSAFALIAGATPPVALGLGIAMFGLQAAIGAANDLIDEPVDRAVKPGKPLPRGLLSRASARIVLAVALSMGLGLSALAGPVVLVVALAVLGVGFSYDLWLKGTVWSWLPFAVGIPILPVYAWLGAMGELPGVFLVLIPTAVVAGAALAIANLLADAERDAAAGVDTPATRLGLRRAWALTVGLQVIVLLIAAASLIALGGRGVGVAGVVAGAALVVAGLAVGRRGSPGRRERAWELEAIGIGVLAAGWIAAVAESGTL